MYTFTVITVVTVLSQALAYSNIDLSQFPTTTRDDLDNSVYDITTTPAPSFDQVDQVANMPAEAPKMSSGCFQNIKTDIVPPNAPLPDNTAGYMPLSDPVPPPPPMPFRSHYPMNRPGAWNQWNRPQGPPFPYRNQFGYNPNWRQHQMPPHFNPMMGQMNNFGPYNGPVEPQFQRFGQMNNFGSYNGPVAPQFQRFGYPGSNFHHPMVIVKLLQPIILPVATRYHEIENNNIEDQKYTNGMYRRNFVGKFGPRKFQNDMSSEVQDSAEVFAPNMMHRFGPKRFANERYTRRTYDRFDRPFPAMRQNYGRYRFNNNDDNNMHITVKLE